MLNEMGLEIVDMRIFPSVLVESGDMKGLKRFERAILPSPFSLFCCNMSNKWNYIESEKTNYFQEQTWFIVREKILGRNPMIYGNAMKHERALYWR